VTGLTLGDNHSDRSLSPAASSVPFGCAPHCWRPLVCGWGKSQRLRWRVDNPHDWQRLPIQFPMKRDVSHMRLLPANPFLPGCRPDDRWSPAALALGSGRHPQVRMTASKRIGRGEWLFGPKYRKSCSSWGKDSHLSVGNTASRSTIRISTSICCTSTRPSGRLPWGVNAWPKR
jgi:hypothetical protein